MASKYQSESLRFALTTPFVVLLFFWPNFTDPFNLPKLLLLSWCVLGVFVLHLFQMNSLKEFLKSSILTKIYSISLLIFIGAIGISQLGGDLPFWRVILGGVNRNNGVLYYTAVTLLSIVIVTQTRSFEYERLILRLFLFTSVFLSAYGVIQLFGKDFVKLNNPYNRIVLTLGNPNFSSSALAIFGIASFFFGIKFLKQSNGQKNVLLFFVLFLTQSILSWKTESLQGLLIIVLGVWLILGAEILRHRSRSMKMLFLGITLLATSFAFTSFLGFGPLGKIFEQYTLKLRFIYASYGVEAIKDNLFSGLGADQYLRAFLKYRSQEFINQYGIEVVTDNAHSVPINIGANFGLFAFLSFLSLQIVVLIKSFKNLYFSRNHADSADILSICSILLILQSFLSIEQIGLGTLLWTFGAAVIQTVPEKSQQRKLSESLIETKKPRAVRNIFKELTILILTFVTVPMLKFGQEDIAWKRIAYLEYQGDSDSSFVLTEYHKLSDLTLNDPRRISPLVDNLLKTGDQKTTFDLIKKTYDQFPEDVYAVELLANVREFEGQKPEQLKLLAEVISLDPMNIQSWLKRGVAAREANDLALAKKCFERIMEIAPRSEQATKAAIELQKIGNGS